MPTRHDNRILRFFERVPRLTTVIYVLKASKSANEYNVYSSCGLTIFTSDILMIVKTTYLLECPLPSASAALPLKEEGRKGATFPLGRPEGL